MGGLGFFFWEGDVTEGKQKEMDEDDEDAESEAT